MKATTPGFSNAATHIRGEEEPNPVGVYRLRGKSQQFVDQGAHFAKVRWVIAST
jgi:hypothetical protein